MNYLDCTLEEMVKHVITSNGASVTRMKAYYKERGITEVVEKIDKARDLARIHKLETKLKTLKETHNGIDSQDSEGSV